MREEASSFEKIDYVYVIYLICLDRMSQYLILISIFFLGNCFAKLAFNLTNPFEGVPQGLQLKRSYLGFSLGFPVTGASLGSWVLRMPHGVSKYIF